MTLNSLSNKKRNIETKISPDSSFWVLFICVYNILNHCLISEKAITIVVLEDVEYINIIFENYVLCSVFSILVG